MSNAGHNSEFFKLDINSWSRIQVGVMGEGCRGNNYENESNNLCLIDTKRSSYSAGTSG